MPLFRYPSQRFVLPALPAQIGENRVALKEIVWRIKLENFTSAEHKHFVHVDDCPEAI